MIHYSLAPICLFVYKRPKATKRIIESLLQNSLASASELHIFSDGAATEKDRDRVDAVRKYIAGVSGFKSIDIYAAEDNKGLAQSIIGGVTNIINRKGNVIVLEDDLLVANNFLHFMNEALDYYQFNHKVFSIAGYTSPIVSHHQADVYFTKRASSWGWATWHNRWDKVDWSVSDFHSFKTNRYQQKQFNKMGSDLSLMLRKQMEGRINSWAIRWVYHQFRHDLYTVFPVTSKVSNEGFTRSATNTSSNNASRFATCLDQSGAEHFTFEAQPFLDNDLLKQFVSPYTIRTRAIYKIKQLLQFY